MEIKHILLILILIFAAWACIDSEQVSSRENPEKKGGNVGGKSSLVTEKKFDFDLSTATEIADSGSKGETLLKGEPISSGRAQEIFKRLPELPSDNSLAKDFNRRKDTMPAPRGGETIKVSFPPAEELAPPKVESEAEKEGKPAILERYSPQGNIDRTKAISLTFDRSMIALQDVQSANSIAPATIKPEVKGHWRWVGTKTALFEAEGTFLPMSTDYTVEVSKSLKDANGRPIEKDYSFNFTTATLKIIGKSPYAGAVTGPRPSFYLAFNQSVDVNRLKEFITLREGNSTEVEIEFLPAKDAAKEGFSNLKDLPDDRYVIFRPKNDLKADTKHTVTLAKGAVSQEGPLVTSADESYSFKTYPPLTIVDTNADNLWGRDSLSPYDDWIIRFSNSLDGETFAPKDMVVSVAPEVKNLNTSITGSTLKISGDFEANQKYIITISAKTTDIYGQTLGHDQKLAFKVGDFDPFVFIPGKDLRVLEATGPRVFNIYTGNVKKFRAKLFKVTPEDYQTFYASGN
ncbi:Ig-like domain-containing protein, partial [bacterium]|nr:Ig-like domain-containing protein [bacterium]